MISSGAFLGMFLVAEKKSAAVLESVDKRCNSAIESAQKMGTGYQEIAKSWEHSVEQLKIELAEKEAKLDAKDSRIDALMAQLSDMSSSLDKAHSQETLAKMMICDKIYCSKRRPPYGSGCSYDFSKPHTCGDDEDKNEQS